MNESKNAALLFKVSLLLTASFLGPNKTGKQTAAEGLLGGTRTRSGLCAPSQVAFTFGLRFTSATNTVLIYGTALLQGMFLGFVGRSLGDIPAVDDDPLGAWTAARDVVQADLDDPVGSEKSSP